MASTSLASRTRANVSESDVAKAGDYGEHDDCKTFMRTWVQLLNSEFRSRAYRKAALIKD